MSSPRAKGWKCNTAPFFSPTLHLLLNLVTGSIINNYQNIREEQRKDNEFEESSAG